jgi:hypothetical protein
MGDIQVLKEIGLQEVSKRTHIEVKTLQYMLDKEFDKLGRINTVGFVKIISREFHLDLSEWQEEFEAYWDEKSGSIPSKAEAVFAVNTASSPKKSIFKSKIFLLILILLLAFGFRYFGLWETIQPVISDKIAQWTQTQENEQTKTQENEQIKAQESVSYTTPSVVSEAQKILEEEPIAQMNETDVITEINGPLENNISESILPEESEKENAIIEQLENVQENVQENVEENTEEEIVQESPQIEQIPQASTQENNGENLGSILPNVNIWVGIVYLDNKKRDSYLTNKAIKLDLTREQIITTGHGNFTLELNGKKTPYKEELPKRFHWDGKEIRSINYDEFVALNGGASW